MSPKHSSPPLLPLLDLSRRYCEPHRRYHNIEHPAHMLFVARQLALTDEQIAAVWFHDAIYDPSRKDNEERSAALAVEQLTMLGWPEHSVRSVEAIVLDTKRHTPTSDASRAVIDLDLEPLSETWDVFQRNALHVRVEYRDIDDETFHQGRRRFLEEMLGRERLYWTTWGARYELPARRNLQRALRELLETT